MRVADDSQGPLWLGALRAPGYLLYAASDKFAGLLVPVNGPDREAMLAVAACADQTLHVGMPGRLFQESLDDRRGSTSCPSWQRAHEASRVSVGNMMSGGMMLASSLRCAFEGPWHETQPTPLDA